MKEIKISGEYIKLGQLLKYAGCVITGADAKKEIEEGKVLLNGKVEYQRGKKIKSEDIIEFNGEKFRICK